MKSPQFLFEKHDSSLNVCYILNFQKVLAEQKAEENKWEGIPEWKKKLMLEKEKKKNDDSVSIGSFVFYNETFGYKSALFINETFNTLTINCVCF